MNAAILVTVLLAAAQAGADSARAHAERGVALAQKGELAGAETELRQAVALAPSDPFALGVLGMVLSEESKLAEADTYFERALKINPSDANTRYSLAVNQFRMGNAAAAKQNLARILEHDASNARARSLMAVIEKASRYDAALTHYRAARWADSQLLLEQVVADGAPEPRVLSLLAWCHHKRGGSAESLAMIERAVQAAGADASIYGSAAQLLYEQHNLTGAQAMAARALAIAPNDVFALMVRGSTEMDSGDFRQARETFQRAFELSGSSADSMERLGTAQHGLFEYSEAGSTFEKGVARFPNHARLHLAFGKLLLDTGFRSDTAAQTRGVAMLEKAASLDPSLAEAHYHLGCALLDRGQTTAASAHLEKAVQLGPNDSRAHLALANAYRVQSRTAEQKRELARYRELEAAKAR